MKKGEGEQPALSTERGIELKEPEYGYKELQACYTDI